MRGFDNQRYGKTLTKEEYEKIVEKQIRYQEKKKCRKVNR